MMLRRKQPMNTKILSMDGMRFLMKLMMWENTELPV